MIRPCATPGCGDTVPESAVVCSGCVRRCKDALDQIPALWGELRATYARLDAVGPSGARGGSSTPLPWKPHGREALEVLRDVTTEWARTLVQSGGPWPETGRDANPARYLAAHVHALTRHPHAGQAVDEITDAVRFAWRTVDRPPDTLLVGICEAATADGPACRKRLYASPGDVVAECPGCGTRHYIEHRRRVMLDAAEDLHVTQTVALGWVRLLTDRAIPPATFRSWLNRRRLAPAGHDLDGRPVYRFGDVRHLADRPQRTTHVA